jgi:hypothetical protein
MRWKKCSTNVVTATLTRAWTGMRLFTKVPTASRTRQTPVGVAPRRGARTTNLGIGLAPGLSPSARHFLSLELYSYVRLTRGSTFVNTKLHDRKAFYNWTTAVK